LLNSSDSASWLVVFQSNSRGAEAHDEGEN
jgi:hypothetical protein